MKVSTVEDGREEDSPFGLRPEDTELRLALPGGKRSFSETIDLKLKLGDDRKKKDEGEDKDQARKAQVVGWPPVRSFRKNVLSEKAERSDRNGGEKAINGRSLVKVSMDGAPYLRKIDLKSCKNYEELSEALQAMFSSFTSGKCSSNGRDIGNKRRLMDPVNGSDYVSIYEDADGDWMLVGDVPWEIFVVSCRRLRVIHSSDATSLAPSAQEKQLSRN